MKTVEIKENCLLIDGKPVILLSSSLFYFRIPQMYWEERMRQLKNCGYRAIDVYIPWNFHEKEPGCWDFEGMRDIEQFLRLAKENGLYVVARPGPYICSEWDGGGLPAWIGMKKEGIRQYDEAYLEQVRGWFDKIFPILHRYQYTEEGSVILIQIENELDIYHCREPKLYLEALYDMAKPYDFAVPFVVCTSSQLDVDYCGGTASGVHPAFNIYSSPTHVALEEKMEQIRTELEKSGEAFLTTETMRQHAFLRREMIGGIRLLSPYCQTASANYDCYTGISTWGNDRERPISYMTNDYDHGAMIKADGSVTEEYLEARLLGNLILALGEHLAAGRPCKEGDWKLEADYEKQAERPGILQLKNGGWLSTVVNLGEREGNAYLTVGAKRMEIPVEAYTTKILPIHMPLDAWGLAGVEIICSSLEILTVEGVEGKDCHMIVYGTGSGIWLGDGEQEWHVCPGQKEILQTRGGSLLIEAVTRKEAAECETAYLPKFAEKMSEIRAASSIEEINGERYLFPEPSIEGKITWMEAYGAWDGSAVYAFQMPEKSQGLLLCGAADIVRIWADGRCLPACYGTGNMLHVPIRGEQIRVKTEIWGHNCGHGIGYPVIEMGSLKGIGKAWGVLEERDIQYNWNYHVLPQCRPQTLRLASRKWPAVSDFGDRLPLAADEMYVWQKELRMPEKGSHRFLHVDGGELCVRVYINGKLAGELTKEKSWLDITEYTHAGRKENVILAYDRTGLNPVPGHVYLVAAQEIRTAKIGFERVEDMKKLRLQGKEEIRLPYSVPNGERMGMNIRVSAREKEQLWLGFDGKGIKLTVICAGVVLGRIFAGCELNGISVCSGNPDRVWLPDRFLKMDEKVLVLAEALEENAVLQRILLEAR